MLTEKQIKILKISLKVLNVLVILGFLGVMIYYFGIPNLKKYIVESELKSIDTKIKLMSDSDTKNDVALTELQTEIFNKGMSTAAGIIIQSVSKSGEIEITKDLTLVPKQTINATPTIKK